MTCQVHVPFLDQEPLVWSWLVRGPVLDANRQQACCAMQGLASPVVAHGLLQHETKLSVLNFTVKKDSNLTETLPNKAELLFVTGLRSVPCCLCFVCIGMA